MYGSYRSQLPFLHFTSSLVKDEVGLCRQQTVHLLQLGELCYQFHVVGVLHELLSHLYQALGDVMSTKLSMSLNTICLSFSGFNLSCRLAVDTSCSPVIMPASRLTAGSG